jgi:HK97 family phage major capsid protein
MSNPHIEKLHSAVGQVANGILDDAEKNKRGLLDDEHEAVQLADDILHGLGKPKRSIKLSGGTPKGFELRPIGRIGARYEELFPEVRYNTPNVRQSLVDFFEKRVMISGSAPSGGYLVPNELWGNVYNYLVRESIFLGRMPVFPMNSVTLSIPALDSEDGTAGYLGQVGVQWRAEGGTFTSTDIKFRQILLTAHKCGVFMTASAECLADSGGRLESIIGTTIRLALRQAIDEMVLVGTGVGGQLGVLSAPGTITVNRALANNISYADLVRMVARIHPIWASKAIWVCSPEVLEELMNLVDGNNNLIWNVNGVAGAGVALPDTLLGRPLFVTDFASALGDRGDITLVAPEAIAFGLRSDLTLETSNSVHWYEQQLDWRGILRADSCPLIHKPIQPRSGGQTLSYAVTLE